VWGFSQEPGDGPPPKVGLVLSGGGAKGLAHIGVLKVLEEAGVTVDYIGGTSMGAIVGALYASGYGAEELDSIFRTTEFTSLIQDHVPRGAMSFQEKENSEKYALSLPFTNFRVSFPQAISGGQNIFNELVRLLYHVKDVNDFNELPIPFLCMATNMETGEAVLLDRGFLPEAILASGTFPSLFEPSEIDGNILIDGGVVYNYPIEQDRAMGADLIIGLDVQAALASRGSLSSAMEILLQINNYRTVNDMRRKAGKTDIYIKPDIGGFSVIDFGRGPAIVERGERAARDKMEELRALARTQGSPPLRKAPTPTTDSLTINRMLITGNDLYTRGYIQGKLPLKLSEKIALDDLKQSN